MKYKCRHSFYNHRTNIKSKEQYCIECDCKIYKHEKHERFIGIKFNINSNKRFIVKKVKVNNKWKQIEEEIDPKGLVINLKL